MPAFEAIKLNDGTSERTFTPSNIDPRKDVAIFKDQSSGIPVGYPSLTVSVTEPAANAVTGVARVKIQLGLPKVDAITPTGGSVASQSVINVARCHMEFILPIQGTLADRQTILKLAAAVLANSSITAVVEKLEHIY